MTALLSRLRAWTRPIADAELPELDARMLAGVRVLGIIAAVASPSFALLSLVSAPEHLAGAVAMAIVCSVAFTVAVALTRVRRIPTQFHVVHVMLLVVLGSTFTGMFSPAMRAFVTYSAALPVAVSALFPWRPSWSIGLGVSCVTLTLAAFPQDVAVPVGMFILLGASYTAVAAIANQLHRRLWLELETTRRSLLAFDRLSTLGRAAAGMAHELKTPTAAALNSFAVVERLATELSDSAGHPDVTDEDLRGIATDLHMNAQLGTRSMERAGRFLQAIRGQTLGMNASEIIVFGAADQVGNAIFLLGHEARGASIALISDVDAMVVLHGDPSKFGQVVTNLAANALHACIESKRGSSVRVIVTREEGGVLLVVEDDGPGVPAAVVATLFEPLVTTRADGGGTGLGLSISRDIVEAAFGGTLRNVATATGARFEAFFPTNGARPVQQGAFVPGHAIRTTTSTPPTRLRASGREGGGVD